MSIDRTDKIMLICIAVAMAFCLSLVVLGNKKYLPNNTHMNYQLIEGKLVNVTLDSLECELLKLNIEKTKRNVIFQYEIKR